MKRTQEPAEWAALGLVGVQQGLIGQLRLTRRLPAKVPALLDACVHALAPARLCTWGASPARRCARPGSGGRGGSAVQSRPARQGHVTEPAVGKTSARSASDGRANAGWPQRRVGGMLARPVAGGRARRRRRCPSGRGRRGRCRGPAPPSTSPGRRGISYDGTAPYDARGLLIAGIPWRHAMS